MWKLIVIVIACVSIILSILSLTYTEQFSNPGINRVLSTYDAEQTPYVDKNQPQSIIEGPLKGINVCICYFGLSRNALSLGTLEAIEENWMKPLKDMGIIPDIYLHTYNLAILNLERSREQCKLNPDEWKLLKPNYYLVTDQNEFDNSYDISKIAEYGDGWAKDKEKYGTQLPNLLRQFNSLKTVTGLIKKKYDVYIYLRPDLLYLDPITPSVIKNIANSSKSIIATPNWQLWGGMNDRFAVMNEEAALLYGNRLDNILDFCEKKGPLHSETYLKWLMKENKVKSIKLKIKAQRVRCNGIIHSEKWNK